MGGALFGIVAVFAQLRVDTIRDNTRRGLEHARAQGRLGRRPTVISTERVTAAVKLRDAGTSTSAIARTLRVGASSVTCALNRHDLAGSQQEPALARQHTTNGVTFQSSLPTVPHAPNRGNSSSNRSSDTSS